jgi:hypothetical protein
VLENLLRVGGLRRAGKVSFVGIIRKLFPQRDFHSLYLATSYGTVCAGCAWGSDPSMCETSEVIVMKRTRSAAITGIAALIGLVPLLAAQQPAAGGKPDPVAALKQSISEGTKKLAQYEWVETTVISMKGEEKSRKQNRCYYGADGKVQKVAMADAPKADQGGGGKPGKRGGGLKSKVIENKKEDIQEYMKQAAALIHSYVPPQPQQIQAAKDGGRVAVNPQPGGKARIEVKQYLKPGDSLTIDLDTAANSLLGLGVNSYIDKPDEPVTLAVQMATLPDGAMYAAKTTLDATAKNITVVITNSGHHPMAK